MKSDRDTKIVKKLDLYRDTKVAEAYTTQFIKRVTEREEVKYVLHHCAKNEVSAATQGFVNVAPLEAHVLRIIDQAAAGKDLSTQELVSDSLTEYYNVIVESVFHTINNTFTPSEEKIEMLGVTISESGPC